MKKDKYIAPSVESLEQALRPYSLQVVLSIEGRIDDFEDGSNIKDFEEDGDM